MKLVQFHLPESGRRIGVIDGDQVLDVTSSELRSTMDIIEKATSEDTEVEEIVSGLDSVGCYSYADLDIPPSKSMPHLLIPIFPPEVWGCGVTYKRSAEMRDEDTTGEKEMKSAFIFVMCHLCDLNCGGLSLELADESPIILQTRSDRIYRQFKLQDMILQR